MRPAPSDDDDNNNNNSNNHNLAKFFCRPRSARTVWFAPVRKSAGARADATGRSPHRCDSPNP
jgi:hypothetical protein